jgi:6-phosphogluconolactonase
MDHQNLERMISFDSKTELEIALAKIIEAYLNEAQQQRGSATLLLSGGSTPGGVYRLLSNTNLNWSNIKVGLVDERFVGPESEFSNFTLLSQTLLQNRAAKAELIPMVFDTADYQKNLEKVEHAYRIFTEPDVCLLGMGPDGHTASIFPNDAASQKALISNSAVAFNTNAPAHPTQRITCSAELLKNSKHLFLMLTGKQKLEVFEQAETLQLPIAAFKHSLQETYYTES